MLFPLVEKTSDDLFGELDEPLKPIDFLIKSEEHGIPQTRHRVIICGIRKSLVARIGLPQQLTRQKPTSLADVISGSSQIAKQNNQKAVTDDDWEKVVSNEISRLVAISPPEVSSKTSYAKAVKKARVKRNKPLAEFLEDSLGTITEHKTRSHMLSDLARYYFCADYAEREFRSPRISDWPTGELAPPRRYHDREID